MLVFLPSWPSRSQHKCHGEPRLEFKGKVTGQTTGESLPGVTVQLKGTLLGAATDLNGNYVIPNVPAGSYTLKASYVGSKTLEIKIQLSEDQQH